MRGSCHNIAVRRRRVALLLAPCAALRLILGPALLSTLVTVGAGPAAAPAPPLTDLDGLDFWPAGVHVASEAGQAFCEITVSLDEPVAISRFAAEITLRSEPGLSLLDPVFWAPVCAPQLGVVLESLVRGTDDASMIASGSVDPPGFAGPGRLFSCSLDLGDAMFLPTIVDFETSATEAYDPRSSLIEPLPSMSVTDIDCRVVGMTTTMGAASTTTFPALTTTTLVPPDEICFVTLVLGESQALTSLALAVDYRSAPGDFAGEGAAVECADLLDATAFDVFDDDAGRRLELRMARQGGFTGPWELAVCAFGALATELPSAQDFVLSRVNATDELGAPLIPGPPVSVAGVACPAPASSSTWTSTSSSLLGWTGSSRSSSSSTSLPPLLTTTSIPPPGAACADPAGDGVTATDALVVLQAAALAGSCPGCVCDVDGSGAVAATDALIALQAAVGVEAAVSCPACGGSRR